jgi:dipeptidyl aminopeptidase/acylaminoacyl peptidase
LSSITALQTGYFVGALDLAGAVDPLTEFETASDLHLRTAALALMGGRLPSDDPRLWASARATTWVGRHRFAFLVMQCRDDPTVPFASSTEFAAALRDHDYPVTLLPLPGTNHELNTWHDLQLEDQWTEQVLHDANR